MFYNNPSLIPLDLRCLIQNNLNDINISLFKYLKFVLKHVTRLIFNVTGFNSKFSRRIARFRHFSEILFSTEFCNIPDQIYPLRVYVAVV